MTLGNILNRVKWIYYGDSTAPTSVDTHFQDATEGIITSIHRKIQEDFDYWFMEESYNNPVVAYTRQVALPSNFKHEIEPIRVLRYSPDTYIVGTAVCSGTTTVTGTSTVWDTAWSGKKYQITWDSVSWYNINYVASDTSIILDSAGPSASGAYIIRKCIGSIALNKFTTETAAWADQDLSGRGTYPLYYDIWENYINIYPMPTENIVIDYRYYKYFDKPTSFSSHTDSLTEEAPDLIVYKALSELAIALDNTKVQLYMGRADQELLQLKKKHLARRFGGMTNLKTNFAGNRHKNIFSEFMG